MHFLTKFVGALLIASLAIACGGGSSPGPGSSAPVSKTTPASATAPAASNDAQPSVLKVPGEATIGDRTTCPTSGEEFTVTASSPKVEYKGRTYYFCCGGCDQKFAKDPEKYLPKRPGA